MKLNRFIAPDARSAMQQIKAAFGPDAVILSSHKVDEGVEVVAAIDFDESIITPKSAASIAEPASQKVQIFNTPMDDMRQEIQTLRGMLEAQISGSGGEPLHNMLFQKLIYLGVSPNKAFEWANNVNSKLNQDRAWQQIEEFISDQLIMKKSQSLEEGGIYAFLGPTGGGKTTSLAKLASRYSLKYGAENMGIITMDTHRIAAQEQLKIYGKVLGVPVYSAADKTTLKRVLKQFNQKKLILIDTAGMNPSDEKANKQLELLSSSLESISKVLVLPATSQHQVLQEAIRHHKISSIDQCIITKLDEALALGGVISAVIDANIPLGYFTDGQRVPEDLKMATKHQLMELFSKHSNQLVHPKKQKKPLFARGELYV